MNNVLEIYCLRDQKLDCFLNPMFLQSKGQAMRLIADTIARGVGKEEAPMVAHHPEDFELFFVGMWDAKNGEFQVTKPESVCLCQDLVRKSNGGST